MKTTAYLSLGSNIDDRLDYMNSAKEKLKNSGIKIIKESKIYETEPWGKDCEGEHPSFEFGQKWFLNQIIKIQTSLEPIGLLEVCQKIEKKLGRTQKHHWGSREIDIDILLYSREVIDLPELQIPHVHMQNRRFVLKPLLEIEPNIKDPLSGESYKCILDNLEDSNKVVPFL